MSDRVVRAGTGFLAAAAMLLGAAPASAAVFAVDSAADMRDSTPDGVCGTVLGTCTLRAAIDEANALDGDDTITLPPDTYVMALVGADDTNAAGDFDVADANNTLTIDGSGTAANTVIDGNDLDRLFDLVNNGSLALLDVTVTDGTAGSGGGIEVDGNPSMLTLTRSVVSGNVATGSGGGINITSGSTQLAVNAVTATDSTIADNDASTGGGINNTSADAIALIDSAVTGNDASFTGGGLNLTGGEGLTLTRTRISGNSAGTNGGAINNSSDSDPETITDSTIAGNTAGTNGGAIYHTASGGPAAGLVLTGTTASGNTATGGQGGGIYNTGSPISLTNSTFSGNSAPAGTGGAMHHTGGDVTATHVTFSGNSATQGGAIFQAAISSTATTLQSTILSAGSSGGACGGNGSPASAGSNIDSDGTCALTGAGDRSGVDPLLGPLAENGGPTQTHALTAGSPAIDTAAAAACPPTDQRGVARPQGPGCDVGAFEAAVVSVGPTPTPSPIPTPIPTQTGLPGPVLFELVNVTPVRGTVFVSVTSDGARASQSRTVPGIKGRTFVPLTEARQIPVGSFLDTRRGTVRLASARNAAGATQTGNFAAGVFQVLQSRRARPRGMTELRLKGSSFRRCGRPSRTSVARASQVSRRTIRRLRSSATGRFRTRGRHSSATVRGTVWTTTDRCDGTLTTVKRGRVAVRDFRRGRTIVLRRGKAYLARAPR